MPHCVGYGLDEMTFARLCMHALLAMISVDSPRKPIVYTKYVFAARWIAWPHADL